MTTLVVAARADRDIERLLDHLRGVGSFAVASSYEREIDAYLAKLIDFPEMGAPRTSLGAYIRIGVIAPYLVVYRHDPRRDRIAILRILHGRRDIARIVGLGKSRSS